MGVDRRRVRVAVAATLATLMLAAGCGNRVPHEEIAAVGNGYGPVDAAGDRDAMTVGRGAPAGGEVTDVAGLGAAPAATPGASGVTGPGGTSAAPSTGPATSTGGGAKVDSGDRSARGGSAPAPCSGSLPPIVLGQTLATSGVVGSAIAGLRQGLAVWAKDVNARGGVQCHPIQLIQLDDGSDPARVAANWNTLVKERGAVAVLGAGVPIGIAALRSAAERDKVPVIGGDVASVDWVQSPYLFLTGGAPLSALDGAVVEAVNAAKESPKKAGLVYCVEAAICTSLKNSFARSAERAGAALGPVQAVSMTQPDFTTECQMMKNAGATTVYVGVDGSGVTRFARSCASLNYFPTIANGAIAVSAQSAADPTVRKVGMYLGSGVVPFTTKDTPGAAAFHAAFDRFAPNATKDQPTLLGWASGKLFEAALSKVAAQARTGVVTTQTVLDGLWQLKGETLDGMGPGVTFTKGGAAKEVDCYYAFKLDTAGFSAPRGSKAVCFKNDKPVLNGGG